MIKNNMLLAMSRWRKANSVMPSCLAFHWRRLIELDSAFLTLVHTARQIRRSVVSSRMSVASPSFISNSSDFLNRNLTSLLWLSVNRGISCSLLV